MAWLTYAVDRLAHWRAALKRELLRDPDVILFERPIDAADHPASDALGAR